MKDIREEEKRTFTIYGEYYLKMLAFEKKHNQSCEKRYRDSFGSLLSYTFVPSGIGDIISVECACGEKIVISEDFDF